MFCVIFCCPPVVHKHRENRTNWFQLGTVVNIQVSKDSVVRINFPIWSHCVEQRLTWAIIITNLNDADALGALVAVWEGGESES